MRNLLRAFRHNGRRLTTSQAFKLALYRAELKKLRIERVTHRPNACVRRAGGGTK